MHHDDCFVLDMQLASHITLLTHYHAMWTLQCLKAVVLEANLKQNSHSRSGCGSGWHTKMVEGPRWIKFELWRAFSHSDSVPQKFPDGPTQTFWTSPNMNRKIQLAAAAFIAAALAAATLDAVVHIHYKDMCIHNIITHKDSHTSSKTLHAKSYAHDIQI